MEMSMNEPMSYTCSGTAWLDAASMPGTYLYHLLAGVALFIWGLHWQYAIYRSWLTQTTQRGYRAKATWGVASPLLPEAWPVEAVLKVAVSLAGIVANVAHGTPDTCPDHTPRAGHFDPEMASYIGNAWVLFAFLLSGLVDLLALVVELPNGTTNFFTASGFLLQGFLLSQAQHANMMAGNAYYLLYLLSMATALSIMLEAAIPSSRFMSCTRVYSTFMQAIWYFNLAYMLYGDSAVWASVYPLPDMAPAAFVPVPFVFWMNLTSVTMLLVFGVMSVLLGAPLPEVVTYHQASATCGGGGGSSAPAPPPGYHSPGKHMGHAIGKDVGFAEMVPLVARH